MSATETTLRRSGRERTVTKTYVSLPSSKRKRADSSDDERDEDDEDDSELSEPESEEDKNDEEVEFPDPRPRKKSTTAKTTQATPTSTKRPAAKKLRTAITSGRRRKASAFDTVAAAKDASISDDNALFNALLNPATALESTVQDFLDSFNTTPEAASADLVNCIFRLCGCNASVNSDEVMDSDGVVDFLGDVVEEIKGTETQGYPLISKAPVFRKLRKSLSEFFDRLVKAAAESEALFSSELISTLQSWIVAMSSAQLRSFRHTATVVALEIESALCIVAAAIEKEAETVGRQKDVERKKRKGAGSASEREKTLSAKAAEIKGRKTKTNEFLKDFFDGVFVHRYRDADAGIRADCVREMGIWLKRHPSHFLEGNYLRYVGWVLSDVNTVVRLEAVKSLQSLYSKPEYLITIQHFTERFKPRLIAIATSDTDLSVRVAVIHVLRAIDAASLLDEDQRASLCVLIFDEEAKVRKAISSFVKGVWEETVKERLIGREEEDDDDDDSATFKLAGAKAFASLLVGWERTLLKRSDSLDSASQMSEQVGDSHGQQSSSSHQHGMSTPLLNISAQQKGRTALAVEALWDDVDAVRDWQTLLDILLLDHSGSGANDDDASTSPKRMRGKKTKGNAASPVKKSRNKGQTSNVKDLDEEDAVDEAWRLEEDEEPALVEVLLACLQKTLADEATRKGGDLDSAQVDTTRALIKALPQLFTKHQTDSARMTELLKLPQLMKLDLFLEMRMMKAYEALWDDIIKHILTQTSPTLLNSALSTMSYMLSATLLSNTNNAKLVELDDELAENLRDAVATHPELETATFSTEEIEKLTGITIRLVRMAERRDMTGWMEDDAGGKRSNAWDIISALMERGRLGRKEEETVVNNSIGLLSLHIAWKASKLPALSQDGDNSVELLHKKRDYLVEQLAGFVSGGQFNTTNSVKRTAFQSLITLYILFGRYSANPSDSSSPLSSLALKMDERLQHQCAGFIQAEAESFGEEIQERDAVRTNSSRATSLSDQEQTVDDDDEDDDETPVKATYQKRKSKGKDQTLNGVAEHPPTKRDVAADMAREYSFISVISYFLRAINADTIDPRHASVLLAHHGRLGIQFDHCLSAVISVLREEGMYKNNGALVEQVVTEALQQSFTMYMDGQTDSIAPAVGLAKALSPVFVIRGAHLSITQRLASQHIVEIHNTLLTWIVKRIAGYEANGNKKKKADSIEFFRVLHALLNTIDSREATQIKAQLDKAFEMAKLNVPATAKAWDAERLYDKRLLGAMAKDKSIVAKGKAIAAENRTFGGAEGTDGELDTDTTRKTAKRKKPKAQPTRRSARVANASGASSGDDEPGLLDNDVEDDGDEEDVFGVRKTAGKTSTSAAGPSPSKPRPRPRRTKTPESEPFNENDDAAESTPSLSPPPPPPAAATQSPTKMAGRKRARPIDDLEEDENIDIRSTGGSPVARASLSPRKRHASPAASEISEMEFTSTRKRARR